MRELYWCEGLDNVHAASEDAVSLQCLQVALNDIRFVCYMDGAKLHAFAGINSKDDFATTLV